MAKLSRSHLLAVAGAALLAPRRLGAQTLEKIRFTGVPTDDMTPIFYALKTGMYQKAGIDMEMIPATSGSTATTAVVSGTYEMGKSSPVAVLLGRLRGLPVVIIGHGPLWDAKNPFTRTLVAADSPIRTASDLNGKLLATAGLNDLAQLGVFAWTDKNGGDAKTLRWVEMPNSAQGAALIEHRIDACTMNEPQVTAALETGKTRVLADGFTAIADRFPIGVYMSHADFAAKHPDVIKKWVSVTYEATKYTNTHRAETAAMMSDVTKIPLAVFTKMVRVEDGTTSDPTMLQPLIEVAAKYKYIPRSFPAKEAYFSG